MIDFNKKSIKAEMMIDFLTMNVFLKIKLTNQNNSLIKITKKENDLIQLIKVVVDNKLYDVFNSDIHFFTIELLEIIQNQIIEDVLKEVKEYPILNC